MKQQVHWALVTERGYINPSHLSYTRKGTIANVLRQYEGARNRLCPGADNAQFWRKLKHKYGWTVRRVGLRVLS